MNEELLDAFFDIMLADVRPPHPNSACHVSVTSFRRCQRCKRAIAATKALASQGYMLPERYFGGEADGKKWSIR